MKNYKFIVAMIVIGTIIAGGLFAQEKYDGSKKNSILGTVGVFAVGIHYERALSKTWTVGAEFESDELLAIPSMDMFTANVFGRWYPTQKAMFVELGLGYGYASWEGYPTAEYNVVAGTPLLNVFSGFDLKAKIGWKLDVGKHGGFVIEPAMHVGVLLGYKETHGNTKYEFPGKAFFNPTFSLGWTF
jgi:hypothetical protein